MKNSPDTNSMRALVRRSAPRYGTVRLTSTQMDALADELECSGATLDLVFPPPEPRCVGAVDGRLIVLDDDQLVEPVEPQARAAHRRAVETGLVAGDEARLGAEARVLKGIRDKMILEAANELARGHAAIEKLDLLAEKQGEAREQTRSTDQPPHAETARVVIEADTAQATSSLVETTQATEALTAAADAAAVALDTLAAKLQTLGDLFKGGQ
jgi:hypothetical protein